MPPAQPSTPPSLPGDNGQTKRRVMIAVICAVGLLVAAAAAWMLWPKSASKKPSAAAETKLYDALGGVTSQQKLRVAMYRATYATKAAADAGANPAGVASSVAEIDVPGRAFRAVYTYKWPTTTAFTSGRCFNQQPWLDSRAAKDRPTTLAAAVQQLELIRRDITELPIEPCKKVGLYPDASSDTAAFRLSDGVIPVTLTEEQAANWKAKIKSAQLFEVRDEGLVTHEGRQVRKLSFQPRSGVTRTGQKLYEIFYDAAEIEQIKASGAQGEYEFEFIGLSPANNGEIAGYYLIDEQTGLPVYSELRSEGKDRDPSIAASGFNLARTKQRYTYPDQLTLTETSPLELTR